MGGADSTPTKVKDTIVCNTSTRQGQRHHTRSWRTLPAGAHKRRKKRLTPYLQDLLRDELILDPRMSHEEMISFLHAVTGILVPLSSINQALKAIGRSTKSRRCVARRQDAELRSLYLYRISRYETNQLVFVDQSADDDKKGRRRKGWSPCESSKTHYQIVPAYTEDGVFLFRIFTGSVTAASFEDFIKQLLYHCGRWPAPKSVLVMEDTPCHNREMTELLCAAGGVKLLLLPTDSTDLNPVGGLMSGVESFIEKHRDEYNSLAQDDFESFLSMCMGVLGCQQAKARHHFQLAGLSVEEESCKQ